MALRVFVGITSCRVRPGFGVNMKVAKGMYVNPHSFIRVRTESGYTQREFAELAGLSERTIQRWERTNTKRPAKASLASVGRLADALKIERKVFVRDIKANFPVLKKSAVPSMQMSDAFG